MNKPALKAMLIRHEGLRLTNYKDSLGFNTIGYGRCTDTQGISEKEADFMLENDIDAVILACTVNFTWFQGLDDSRQAVIADMVYNMGLDHFKAFKRMISAIEAKNYEDAANEMLCSIWASQVKSRAVELAEMMKNGDTVH